MACEKNIVAQIVEQRKKDIAERGYNFGYEIPKKRERPVFPFMQNRGVILEVKRASPSKGDIAPQLNAAKTALTYAECGASAISVLTEENYFKGSIADLIAVCKAVNNAAVLRKDFLIDEEEIQIAYLCGADAVLLIAGILEKEKLESMIKKCASLGIKAFVEVRTLSDAEKINSLKKYSDTIVCGINSRNLKTFDVDTLVPAMYKSLLGTKVVFESGLLSSQACTKAGEIGFTGILLGEGAARNPDMAKEFVISFMNAQQNANGIFWTRVAQKIYSNKKNNRPLVKLCGLTNCEDAVYAAKAGADFCGFILSEGYSRSISLQTAEKCCREVKKISEAITVAVLTELKSKKAESVIKLVRENKIDCIQVHGIEYKEAEKILEGIPHYYTVCGDGESLTKKTEDLSFFGEPRFIQDSKNHEYKKPANGELWLAGGITPENFFELVKKFNPELIDISGGTETVTGKKDYGKIDRIFEKISYGE